jgi:hypothetical protein
VRANAKANVLRMPDPSAIEQVVARWHAFVQGEDPNALEALLDDDVVLYSPIVFTPQRGKQTTTLYLQAAARTFPGDAAHSSERGEGESSPGGGFRYTKSAMNVDTAFLEFETTMEGKYVNGIDIIRCNELARIVEFRVMIRPLQAVNLVHRQMGAMLEALGPS